jgi:hypothetical protein
MQRFLERHKERIVGVLSGFDRLLFRGTLPSWEYSDGLGKVLNSLGVRRSARWAYPRPPATCSTR